MSEQPTYPLELLRAELQAAMAKQMVELMDRFASKRDLADFRSDFARHQEEDTAHFAEIKERLDELLAEKSERDGAMDARKLLRSRRDFWIGASVALFVGVIGAIATVAAYAFLNG